MKRLVRLGGWCAAPLLVLLTASAAAFTVSVEPSIPSTAAVGEMVTWTASAGNSSPGKLWYRFRARAAGEDFRMLRDYGPENVLDWTAGDHEGLYEIEVAVRNLDTGEMASTSLLYGFTSRVETGAPVISRTRNPLVFLYSAPACPTGSRMAVQFIAEDGYLQSTDYHPCREGLSMNFYLAGMRAETQYSVRHVIEGGPDPVWGPALTLTTPAVSLPLAPFKVLKPSPGPQTDGILLQSSLNQTMIATDLQGNLVWYYPGNISFLTDPIAGGTFLGIFWDGNQDSERQILREFDLAGMTVRETNAARVSEQLRALGKRPIGGFHHDARRLPDGNFLVLASNEQILTDVQGPGPVNVIGDEILVLDRDLQVIWVWDAFDHLDTARPAVMGENCARGAGGCAPFYQTDHASDWLHGNSVQFTPDGNILYSARHQDWLIKIDYRNGEGNGEVLWVLGRWGDFQIDSPDAWPWFSHQHDANFLPGDNSTLVVFDNGNTRRAEDATANSRGQVYRLDEINRTATLVLSADLGIYSLALGSARPLPNGNFLFVAGWIPGETAGSGSSHSLELDPSGQVVYDLYAPTQEYRMFRMPDLYNP
ncbi:MAG: aryl-sulfate sulfotransferase [Bryobacterales bacterium]|nr:aryl-sulfate sulfotransferase [Bryobacterales bacterium]